MDSNKRLYRVNEDKILMGVCTGLSEYTDIDVSIIRIVFLLAVISGFPLIIYLIMGLILPIKEIEIRKAETIEEDEYSYNEEDYKI